MSKSGEGGVSGESTVEKVIVSRKTHPENVTKIENSKNNT
jgi:hypothetical protein